MLHGFGLGVGTDDGELQYVFVIVMHHISGDGASMAPLARDVMTAYLAATAGTVPTVAPLSIQYADYTLWQQAVLGQELRWITREQFRDLEFPPADAELIDGLINASL